MGSYSFLKVSEMVNIIENSPLRLIDISREYMDNANDISKLFSKAESSV